MSQTTCLNESFSHGFKDMLKSSGSAHLESDADEQLLLGVAFLQTVKLFALRFTTKEDELDKAPKTIKIFGDNLTIGFDEATSQPAAQEFQLTKEQALGKELVQLRYVKFQKTNSVSVCQSLLQFTLVRLLTALPGRSLSSITKEAMMSAG